MATFKVGDVVQLACGGPAMVVFTTENTADLGASVGLVWIVDGRDVARMYTHPDTLILATAPAAAVVAAPVAVRAAQLQAPTLPGAPA